MAYCSKSAQLKKRSFLDPRTKIGLMLMIVIFVLGNVGSQKIENFRMILTISPYILLAIEQKWRGFFRGVTILIIGYFILYVVPIFSLGSFSRNLIMIGLLIVRFAPGIAMGNYLMSTITISEFVASMEKMHVPQSFTIPMAVMFRFFPTVLEEFKYIGNAMKMRGIYCGRYSLLKVMEFRMVPMITCSIKIGDELSAAALTRGLDTQNNRTNICCIGIRWIDMLIYILCLYIIIKSIV